MTIPNRYLFGGCSRWFKITHLSCTSLGAPLARLGLERQHTAASVV